METRAEVICVGAAIVDIPLQPVSKNIFDCESYPLNQIAMTIGGDAINEATIITKLGHKVSLMSLVGQDPVGDFVLAHCKKIGIDIQGMQIREDIDTSINVGLVTEDGERTFVTNRNGSLWKMQIEDLDLEQVKGARILSYGSFFNNPRLGNEALTTLFSKAKSQGMIVCADMIKPRLGESFDDVAEALSYVDFFFPNFEEAQNMTGEHALERVAEKILGYGVSNVVIKIGKRGAYLRSQDGSEYIVPAMQGITAIDTIGAGDNFASGFITALLEGKDHEECCAYGNVTASLAIQSIGATTGVRDRAQWDQQFLAYQLQQK